MAKMNAVPVLIGVAALGALLFFSGGAKADPLPVPVVPPVVPPVVVPPVVVPPVVVPPVNSAVSDVLARSGGLLNVFQLQTLLLCFRFDPGGVDGAWGKGTSAAVDRYAASVGLPAGVSPAFAARILADFAKSCPLLPNPLASRDVKAIPVYAALRAAAGCGAAPAPNVNVPQYSSQPFSVNYGDSRVYWDVIAPAPVHVEPFDNAPLAPAPNVMLVGKIVASTGGKVLDRNFPNLNDPAWLEFDKDGKKVYAAYSNFRPHNNNVQS